MLVEMAILVDLAEEDEVDVVVTREEEEEEELAVVAVGLRLEILVAIPTRKVPQQPFATLTTTAVPNTDSQVVLAAVFSTGPITLDLVSTASVVLVVLSVKVVTASFSLSAAAAVVVVALPKEVTTARVAAAAAAVVVVGSSSGPRPARERRDSTAPGIVFVWSLFFAFLQGLVRIEYVKGVVIKP